MVCPNDSFSSPSNETRIAQRTSNRTNDNTVHLIDREMEGRDWLLGTLTMVKDNKGPAHKNQVSKRRCHFRKRNNISRHWGLEDELNTDSLHLHRKTMGEKKQDNSVSFDMVELVDEKHDTIVVLKDGSKSNGLSFPGTMTTPQMVGSMQRLHYGNAAA